MLECRGVSVSYGQHRALDQVAIKIAPGEIVVILGANGAGKSTLLAAIAGLVPAAAGQVWVSGKPVTHLPPHRIVEAGVALVPEGRRIFGDLTVRENLLLGAYPRRARAAERDSLDRVFSLFPRLAERRGQIAGTLSGGEQQMVAIGRAVMSSPAILMLDEPSLGLSPLLCSELFRTLAEIRGSGVGVLLVEQNARQSLAIADRGYLLEVGRIVGEDTADRLAQDPAVQAAYLGGAGEAAAPPHPAETTAPGVAAAPPAAQRFATPSARRPSMSKHTDDLIQGSIADLVQRAAEIQAEHIKTLRAARAAAQPYRPGAGGSGDALADSLAKIEAAAANARKPRAQAHPAGAAAPGPPPAPQGLPAIEVYRRPKVEVYRRSKDGHLVLTKGD
jgi:branched-chain amino acid transport system ATP-binding protein